MSITPPAKVKLNSKVKELQILASGIDTLILSVYVEWKDSVIFQYLNEHKEVAREFNQNAVGELEIEGESDRWPFEMKPHGTKGYAWILLGRDYALKVGNWKERMYSPNIMVEIHSETLWRLGVSEAVARVVSIIEGMGAENLEINLSRVDLCVDVMVPDELWGIHLLDFIVTRATDMAPYYKHKNLTGIRIGKGVISARLYDKPLEIKQSKKEWMFDVWGIEGVPDDKKIIRIEFQLRREFLKQVGLDTVEHLNKKDVNAWSYCTKNWLKFQDRPGKHHNQRSTFDWWQKIQNGYHNYQEANPLVREKVFSTDIRRHIAQMNGNLSSYIAIKREKKRVPPNRKESFLNCISEYMEDAEMLDRDIDADLQSRINKKRPRYHRTDKRRLRYGKVKN